jgi:serine/threonine-protein kinase
MGAVYEGQNIAIGKKVALKFIDAEFARHPDVARRFQREAEAASLVESAHIVQIFDSGATDDGIPYIVMELLRGEDLRARLKRLGRLPPHEAVHVMAQTLRGLHRAHEAGIIHRDLKPDNIFLVDRDDDQLFVKIVDFGISKMMRRPGESGHATLTRNGVVMGTPLYMSPEQAQALPDLDLRADLWSVGAIFYECLVGSVPHDGDAYEQIIVAICTTDAVDIRALVPDLPAPLAAIVSKALTRDKARRFQSAKEMLDALAATGLSSATPHGTPPAISSAIEAPPYPGSLANGGATRVSFTQVVPPTLVASAVAFDDARSSRARGMRRRGLVALGGAVMLAAFVLTLGLLRGRKRAPDPSTLSATAESPSAPDTPPRVPSSDPVASVPPRPPPPAPLAAAPAAAPPAPVPQAKRLPVRSNAATNTASVAAPEPAAAPVRSAAKASPPPPGIAGGLQIKTTYP